MNPIFLKPILKQKVWCGDYLGDKIGESWCLTIRNDDTNEILNDYYNSNLNNLYENCNINKRIFGNNFLKSDRFPIMIKYLSVASKLSVQVHPDDKYAKKFDDYGKMEVWYVIDCKDDAYVAYGLKDIYSKKHLFQILQDNRIQDYFNVIKLKKGDIIPVYPGTIHAIIGNAFIYEIQQSSDITFRLFDWNRFEPNRPLHIKESFDVINLKKNKIFECTKEFCCDEFKFKVIFIDGEEVFEAEKDSCSIINVINEGGILILDNKEYVLSYLDTVLIPAEVRDFRIKGKLEIIKSWI